MHPFMACDVHERPADSLRRPSASLPVSPRPARPSVGRREVGGKSRLPSDRVQPTSSPRSLAPMRVESSAGCIWSPRRPGRACTAHYSAHRHPTGYLPGAQDRTAAAGHRRRPRLTLAPASVVWITRHPTQQQSFALLNGQIHRAACPPTAKLGLILLRRRPWPQPVPPW
jgi:hypothetical protein